MQANMSLSGVLLDDAALAADVAALLEQFRFLPRWRMDDVMISFAATGGSVGAHIDQYDVFLLQAQGQRRWQIDARRDPPQHPGEPGLLHVLHPVPAGDLPGPPGSTAELPDHDRIPYRSADCKRFPARRGFRYR